MSFLSFPSFLMLGLVSLPMGSISPCIKSLGVFYMRYEVMSHQSDYSFFDILTF